MVEAGRGSDAAVDGKSKRRRRTTRDTWIRKQEAWIGCTRSECTSTSDDAVTRAGIGDHKRTFMGCGAKETLLYRFHSNSQSDFAARPQILSFSTGTPWLPAASHFQLSEAPCRERGRRELRGFRFTCMVQYMFTAGFRRSITLGHDPGYIRYEDEDRIFLGVKVYPYPRPIFFPGKL
jgi:hypothetical protein